MTERLVVEQVGPAVTGAAYPAKAVVGEHVPIEATAWREGHDAMAVTFSAQGPGIDDRHEQRMVPGPEPDTWTTTFIPHTEGLWTFRVDAWSDPWSTWRHAVEAKIAAGQDEHELANDIESGARLLELVARRPNRSAAKRLLRSAAAELRDGSLVLPARVEKALSEPVQRVMRTYPVRELLTRGQSMQIWVDRPQALFSSWYEFFPRSTGGVDASGKPVHGTFATATKELDRIASMGFDVVYLPPIHPIGTVNRKGPNNSVLSEPQDVGSVWAIGSADGGHDAVHPSLGTLADFKDFVARTHELGMEIALDLALQCAPDHPWVTEHPEWFTTRPDGTIAYAENPPKRYQDIYPLNFDNDPVGLYAEILRVVLHWIGHGVRIFRVDNPHTKPPSFWHWLITQVKSQYPDVLFLSEAFTRPARLYGLARLGFTQSYTYFTWRTTKQELADFGYELVQHSHEARPNLFVNTPDILHASLQEGGPGMFALRATLAATMSPSWGVYSGYELFEHMPLHAGSEEYLDSEKYQLRPRDWQRGPSLEPLLRKLNTIRRAHPALQQIRTLRFHSCDNDRVLAYSKVDPASGDTVLIVLNLDPRDPQEATVTFDLAAIGLPLSFPVRDEITGNVWTWGETAYVRLDPAVAPAHIVWVVGS